MAAKTKFDFKLKDDVKLILSGEKGQVTGRAQYTDSNPMYRVRYVAADGRQVCDWLSEDAIQPAVA